MTALLLDVTIIYKERQPKLITTGTYFAIKILLILKNYETY